MLAPSLERGRRGESPRQRRSRSGCMPASAMAVLGRPCGRHCGKRIFSAPANGTNDPSSGPGFRWCRSSNRPALPGAHAAACFRSAWREDQEGVGHASRPERVQSVSRCPSHARLNRPVGQATSVRHRPVRGRAGPVHIAPLCLSASVWRAGRTLPHALERHRQSDTTHRLARRPPPAAAARHRVVRGSTTVNNRRP